MKLLPILLLLILSFSCQKSENSGGGSSVPNSSGGSPAAPGKSGSGASNDGSQPAKKSLNMAEITDQSIELKENLNFGNAESFPFVKKLDDGRDLEQVKLSFFYQDNKSILSKSLEMSKGYCEVSVTVAPNKNGSTIELLSAKKFFNSGTFSSQETKINNLNYQYDASFSLFLEGLTESLDRVNDQPVTKLNTQPLNMECFNVLDAADLNATLESKFKITKKETK